MSAIALPAPVRVRFSLAAGRAFVHPVFDYLVIGGGLSLLALAEMRRGGASVLAPWLKRNLPPLPSLVVRRAEVNVAAPTGLAPCDWASAQGRLRSYRGAYPSASS